MMSKLKYLLHAVAFIAIAIAAFALKSTKSYQRTNSDSSTVMIAKAERLEMNGDFKGASISYRRAIQRATSEQRACNGQGLQLHHTVSAGMRVCTCCTKTRCPEQKRRAGSGAIRR